MDPKQDSGEGTSFGPLAEFRRQAILFELTALRTRRRTLRDEIKAGNEEIQRLQAECTRKETETGIIWKREGQLLEELSRLTGTEQLAPLSLPSDICELDNADATHAFDAGTPQHRAQPSAGLGDDADDGSAAREMTPVTEKMVILEDEDIDDDTLEPINYIEEPHIASLAEAPSNSIEEEAPDDVPPVDLYTNDSPPTAPKAIIAAPKKSASKSAQRSAVVKKEAFAGEDTVSEALDDHALSAAVESKTKPTTNKTSPGKSASPGAKKSGEHTPKEVRKIRIDEFRRYAAAINKRWNKKDGTYLCPVCNITLRIPKYKRCEIPRHLLLHMKNKNLMPYRCPQEGCGKPLARRDYAQVHMRKVHNLEWTENLAKECVNAESKALIDSYVPKRKCAV